MTHVVVQVILERCRKAFLGVSSALSPGAYLGVASRIRVMTRAFAARRADARARLDGEPDVVVSDGKVGFRHVFETVEDSETFCYAPEDVVDAGRRLLTIDVADGISAAVHDTVVVRVGCNCVPVFAAVSGGRGRGLFSFLWRRLGNEPSRKRPIKTKLIVLCSC